MIEFDSSYNQAHHFSENFHFDVSSSDVSWETRFWLNDKNSDIHFSKIICTKGVEEIGS